MACKAKGKVYFIGAGPGDPELLTIKGQRLISEADLVLYAGSLVPIEVLNSARKTAKIINSAPLNLEECYMLMQETVLNGGMVARVHTGDPSIYGAIQEQIQLLNQNKIAYEVIPGITSACAAAAAAAISFTSPEITQSLVITRLEGRTPVPEREALRHFAAINCSIAVYLSASQVIKLKEEICAVMPKETPILCAYRVGWENQQLVWTTAEHVIETVKKHNFTKQTLFLVLPAENKEICPKNSRLYAPEFTHAWRK